jgi:hypothetical protein
MVINLLSCFLSCNRVYISVITGKKVAGNLDILVNEEYRPDSYCRRIAIGRSGSHVEQRNECNRLIYGGGTRLLKQFIVYIHILILLLDGYPGIFDVFIWGR